jgi:hypothetical protein
MEFMSLSEPHLSDAEVLPMSQMLDHTAWVKLKRYLEHQALEAGSKHLHDLWG